MARIHPPSVPAVPVAGAQLARSRGVDATGALAALSDLTTGETAGNPAGFDGPAAFLPCPDWDLVARTSWALALFTAVCRGGPAEVDRGALQRLRGQAVAPADVLAPAPPAAVGQLACFRRVFEQRLLPELAARTGCGRSAPTSPPHSSCPPTPT